jgi:hypothetical protein
LYWKAGFYLTEHCSVKLAPTLILAASDCLGLSLLPQTDHNALRALRALRRAQVKKSQQQRKLIDGLPTWQLERVDLESGPCAVCLEAHSVGLEARTKYAISGVSESQILVSLSKSDKEKMRSTF